MTIFAELAGASLILNELAETRAGLLGHLFPDVGVTRFDDAYFHKKAAGLVGDRQRVAARPIRALAQEG